MADTMLQDIVAIPSVTSATLLYVVESNTDYKMTIAQLDTYLSGNIDHNDLQAIQGGTTDEYYHLTSAQSVGLNTLSTQYRIPVVGSATGVFAQSTWAINASTMTTPSAGIITAVTSIALTAPAITSGGSLVTTNAAGITTLASSDPRRNPDHW